MLSFRAYLILIALFLGAVALVLLGGMIAEHWFSLRSYHGMAAAAALGLIACLVIWRVRRK